MAKCVVEYAPDRMMCTSTTCFYTHPVIAKGALTLRLPNSQNIHVECLPEDTHFTTNDLSGLDNIQYNDQRSVVAFIRRQSAQAGRVPLLQSVQAGRVPDDGKETLLCLVHSVLDAVLKTTDNAITVSAGEARECLVNDLEKIITSSMASKLPSNPHPQSVPVDPLQRSTMWHLLRADNERRRGIRHGAPEPFLSGMTSSNFPSAGSVQYTPGSNPAASYHDTSTSYLRRRHGMSEDSGVDRLSSQSSSDVYTPYAGNSLHNMSAGTRSGGTSMHNMSTGTGGTRSNI